MTKKEQIQELLDSAGVHNTRSNVQQAITDIISLLIIMQSEDVAKNAGGDILFVDDVASYTADEAASSIKDFVLGGFRDASSVPTTENED